VQKNSSHKEVEIRVVVDVLKESMRAVQGALAQPTGIRPEQLAKRLGEWQETLEQLSESLTVEQRDLLAMLYEIGRAINSSLDLDDTLNTVIDSLIYLTGAERGCLMLLDDEGELSIQLARNFGESAELELSRSVILEVVETRKPVLSTNAQMDPRFATQESVIGYHLRSIACVPLQVRKRVTGALYLDNRIKEAVFSEADMALLSAFANQAAVAIENARLYTLTDQALAARVKELTTMQDIDRELNASLDLHHVLDMTLSWAVRATGAAAGNLRLVGEEGSMNLMAEVGDGQGFEAIEPDTLRVVLSSQEPVVVGNRTILVPIRYEGQARGLLDLRKNDVGIFATDQVQFASRLADHAAIAIENARLYEQVQQANQAKTEFVSIVAHELRTPMTSIRGYADMLSKELVGPLTDQQNEFVSTICNNVERMQILVSDLQDIARIESGQLRMETQPMSLRDSLDEGVRLVRGQIDGKGQALQIEAPQDLPQVHGDPSRTTQVIINLLSNAYKYTPEGGEIRVKASVEKPFVRCTVQDTGIGMSEDDQCKLFTKFFRADNPDAREQPGTGLGLCIVKNIVELQGGEITVESEEGVGTTFSFTIPTVESVAVQ
jgi:signal transduction histidine kinase